MAASRRLMQFAIRDLLLSVLYFPVWWYSVGLKIKLVLFAQRVSALSRDLGLRILLVNFFKPMYGDRSITGRSISFGVRLVQLVVFLLIMIVMTGVFTALLIGYLALPVVGLGLIGLSLRQ